MKTTWRKAEYLGHNDLLVDDKGIIYEHRGGEKILTPADRVWRHGADGHIPLGDANIELLPSELVPGHIIDERAPYRCSRCGEDRLQVYLSGDYETSARCPECGIEEVVHSG